MFIQPIIAVQIIGYGVFLWLGIYILGRAVRRTPIIVIGVLALLLQALFFGGSALTYTTDQLAALTRLQRALWWTAVVPVAIWFHYTSLTVQQVATVGGTTPHIRRTPLVLLCYLVAALITIAGTATSLLIDYNTPAQQAGGIGYLDRGPYYGVYIAYLVVVICGACLNLGRALQLVRRSLHLREQALAQQLRLLVIGGLLFLAGGIWISSRYQWNPVITVLPGYLFLLAGLGGVGYGVARFGLLLDGQDIRRDFVYNLAGIVILNIIYVVLLSSVGVSSAPELLLLVSLVTLTHAGFDYGRDALDKLFFNRAEQTARAEARDYATALGTLPVTLNEPVDQADPVDQIDAVPRDPVPTPDDPPAMPEEAELESANEKAFKSMVRKAITGLKSPPQLAKSPLLALKLVEQRVTQAHLEDNRLNRVTALRELLIEHIESLRPELDANVKVGEAWRFYNVLYYPYVRELSRKAALAEARRLEQERRRNGQREPGELEQVLAWLVDVDEDTFYKWQRKASDTIALMLWEEHRKLADAI